MSTTKLTREKAEKLARDWFAKVDVLDVDGTMSLCGEETVVTFGNQAGVKGDANLRQMFGGFYSHFDKMQHDVRDISIDAEHNAIFIHSDVGYYLKNRAIPVVVPVMTVMRFGPTDWEEPKFGDFRVFFDISPVVALF